MREIKFRAWTTAKKEMFEPVYFDNLEVHWWSEEDGHFIVIGDVREDSILYQAILMEFTGLHDKNGKEIYEGDILLFADGSKSEVFFDEGSFTVEDSESMSMTGYGLSEIIGNIHENAELLK